MASTAWAPSRPASVEESGEAGLHDPDPAGRDGHQPDDPGHGVGQQDQRRPRMGADGPHAEQQAQVVEQQATDRQQGGLPPLLAEHRADDVALLEQPLGQALQRGRAS